MSAGMIPLEYANEVIYELQKAFWDERGRGARFRTTTVGRGYLRERCLPLIQSADLDDIARTAGDFLQREGLSGRVICTREDRLLRLRVEGCVHRPVEDRLAALGIEPFTCAAANLVVLAIEEKTDRPVELAEIKLQDGACDLLLVVFDRRASLR